MLNTMTLICHPLKFLRDPLIRDLKRSYGSQNIILSTNTVSILHKWLFILEDVNRGLPIPRKFDLPPAKAAVMVTDAAGGAALKNNQDLTIGVGCVGFIGHREDDILYAAKCDWPRCFVTTMKDSLGKSFGNKTTLLETLGVLLPIYHNFKYLRGKHVLARVDNVAVMWAFKNGRSRLDPFTSVIVTALHYVLMAMPCYFHIEHLPRMSTEAAELADHLSRNDSRGQEALASLSQYLQVRSDWPPSLLAWMHNPKIDWSLGKKFLFDCRMTL